MNVKQSDSLTGRILKGLNWVVLFLVLVVLFRQLFIVTTPDPIKVGVLHSQSGPMALSELGVINATLMAIDEINQQGGVLGHPLQPMLVDGASNERIFAEGAQYLIEQQVPTIFGCWTSASRKAVKPIIERHQNLLFYPVQYEGLERSERIVYSAEVPNQQIIPTISWIKQHLGTKVALIGSDYVFPHIANRQIKKVAQALDMQIVDEQYYSLSATEFSDLPALLASQPEVIINTLNGDANRYFFRYLRDHDLSIPVMSFSLSEVEAKAFWQEEHLSLAGHYTSWGYDQSVNTAENRRFIQHYRQRYGQDQVVNSPMVNAYTNVYLWKLAVERAQSFDPDKVLSEIHRVGFMGPVGRVFVDKTTHHTWKPNFISQFQQTGETKVVWQSGVLIKPMPYSIFEMTLEDSESVLQMLYQQWGNSWQSPD